MPEKTMSMKPSWEKQVKKTSSKKQDQEIKFKAHLQAAPVKQFPENHDIVEKSACQVAESLKKSKLEKPGSKKQVRKSSPKNPVPTTKSKKESLKNQIKRNKFEEP
jgi:hypothetical protein